MLKIVCLFSLVFSSCIYASPIEQMLTTKEKLRISLWFEGIESKKPQQESKHTANDVKLPEEIERALLKM